MKIYTKTGDDGETSLLGGIRVSKGHVSIEVCGTLDELNCMIGLCRSSPVDEIGEIVGSILLTVQNDLFDIGGRVAGSIGGSSGIPGFDSKRYGMLESRIDQLQAELPPLQQFILPGGSVSGCRLHLARSICRRAERNLVVLRTTELQLDLKNELVYINRLSDFLFVAARFVNRMAKQPEIPWFVSKG